MKICNKCKTEKNILDFNKNKLAKDGLSFWCKNCNIDYKIQNKVILKIKSKEYIENNKNKIKEYQKKYRVNKKNNLKKYSYFVTDERKNYKKEWLKNDRKNNPWIYSHRDILNRLIKKSNYKKTNSTEIELGYTALELKIHIESLFLEGMTWENRKDWHIDHIVPLSYFNKETPAKIVNALSNLQPLWKSENLKKYNKIIYNKDI